ncbi:uncharacterized protein [Physcomitrium patens]|nr:golgin subfamily A member 6-like protein 22 isoform X2 [Physcomitrium patens]XP_024357711.1 golgin subfamily A member 6-like protein 22 isoform X2 [Physcomitrium patens]|eukprot:XP_024357710.1 golgin subfamily A member 6-like protein 22 isoform X2 [Physcomitrella patens]
MEKAEESSALESVEVLDEGGVHQNENNIEENRSRKDADLQEDYNTEHQRVSGESPEEFTSQVKILCRICFFAAIIELSEGCHIKFLLAAVVPDDQTGVLEESPLDLASYLTVHKGEDNASGDASEPLKEAIEFRSLGDDGNSADFAGNFEHILDPSDTGLEDVDLVEHIDIDFDQFGAQPPDLPVLDTSNNEEVEMNVNEVDGIFSSSGEEGTDTSTEASESEHQIKKLVSENEDEQEMKELDDVPVKIDLNDVSEEQLLKELDSESNADLHNTMKISENIEGHGVLRGSGSETTLDEKGVDDASLGSLTRGLANNAEVKGSSAHKEVLRHTYGPKQLTEKQVKQLEEIRCQVDLLSLKRKLEAECGKRLKNEAKLMVLHEILPNVEEKMKVLCDEVLFLEVQFKEQVDFSNKLEANLVQERERVQHVAQVLKEEIHLKKKLQETLEFERNKRVQYVVQLEEKTRLQEELTHKLEEERVVRIQSEAGLMVLHEMLPDVEEKLNDLRDQIETLIAQLQDQKRLREEVEQKLDCERKERLQHVAKVEERTKFYEETLEQERIERLQFVAQLEKRTRLQEELARKLEEERVMRIQSEAGLAVFHEMLPDAEKKLNDLLAQLQSQNGLKKEIEEKLDWERRERMEHVAKTEGEAKMHEEALEQERNKRVQYVVQLEEKTKLQEELARKLEEERDERLISETSLKELLHERLPNDEEKIKELYNQVMSLSAQLEEQRELRKELEERLEQEREERSQRAVVVSETSNESLLVSSVPWPEEKYECVKLLDEQKALLAHQMEEAEKIKSTAQMKVGQLNNQVQNLEVLTDIAETMECVFSAKDRAISQAIWTTFQALCLGLGFIHFITAYRDPVVQNSLLPT